MAPCRFFARGNCLYGASCRNSHDVPVPASAASPSSPSKFRQSGVQEGLQPAPTEYLSSLKASCWFFTQGTCKSGPSCKNIHDVSPASNSEPRSSSQKPAPITSLPTDSGADSQKNGQSKGFLSSERTLKPDAPSFTPRLDVPVVTQAEQTQKPAPCKFFTRGFCRSGAYCRYLHIPLAPNESIQSQEEKEPEQLVITNGLSALSIQDCLSREVNGARVNYSAGAEVVSVKLVSDFSSVQITGVAAVAQASFVRKLLSDLGHPIEESQVILKHLGQAGLVAEVRAENPSFAKDVTRRWEKQKTERNKEISIKPMTAASGNGATGNRLQLSTVACTWYQASRIAWLSYDDEDNADEAMERLEENKIRDRVPDCSVQDHYRRYRDTSYTLQVCNLHGQTTDGDIRGLLRGRLRPNNITLSDPTHDYSDSEAAEIVRGVLQSKGELESFHHQSIPGSNKVKATATFVDRDNAAEAVSVLHNTYVDALGKTKIFINHVVSVKYNVPTSISDALKVELDKLIKEVWRSGHVHLKVYAQTDSSKSFTAIRLFGENLKSVSGAKAELEKLLAGVVVMSGEAPLWDPYFLKSTALADLNEFRKIHKVSVYRDARKSQLLMFGSSLNARNEVQQALVEKVEALRRLQHAIILSPQLLKEAMQGGMRRLKARFGEAVILNIALNPKTITFTGSEEEFHQAQALLVDSCPDTGNVSSAQLTEDCVVCWTEATGSLHTKCGHIYCKDCFSNQASSADERDIPLHCFGSEGKCENIFSTDELKEMLSFTDFENLLQHSFNMHIRTRPKDFQYCPTPDCPQVYRPTNAGETFFCSSCLTPICTKCNVISHDGMTCEEYKDMDSEGNKLFQKYKKEHDVRDCPNCKMGIEKSEGCNHMECKNCGTHICWFCMKTFDVSAQCYSHMKQVHGDYYGEGFWDN